MCTNEENNEITLVIPKSINGSTFHEFDHGGQVARGEFDYIEDGPNEKYHQRDGSFDVKKLNFDSEIL